MTGFNHSESCGRCHQRVCACSAPTIPELVARLRELLSKAHPLPWLYRGKSDSLHTEPDEPPYSYGAGFLRLTEYDDGEATAEDIGLIVAAVNALPTLLDALERQPSGDSGGVESAPFDTDGLEWSERLDGSLDLFRAGSGANLATVYTNGTWFTWDANGTGGESGKAPDVETAKARAIKALVRQPHSPDGGKEEGEPGFLSSDWRPVTEPPTAEEHAWCGGRYLLRHDDGELCPEHWDRSLPWEKWSSGHREYTPIPPSDERRG